MRKKIKSKPVYSKPTMCLGCHLIVVMVHDASADSVAGAWECPNCRRKYPFTHWKIKKQAPDKSKAA